MLTRGSTSPPKCPPRGEAGSPLQPLARNGTLALPPGQRFRVWGHYGPAPWPTARRSSILDRTLLRGASGPVIGEALKQAGVTDRSIPGEQLIYRFYDLFGENRPSMEVTRRAVRFAQGWVREQVQEAGELAADALGGARCSPSPGRSSTSTRRRDDRSCSPPPRPTTS